MLLAIGRSGLLGFRLRVSRVQSFVLFSPLILDPRKIFKPLTDGRLWHNLVTMSSTCRRERAIQACHFLVFSRISLTSMLGGLFHGIRDEEQHDFSDSSAPLFSMYRRMTEEEDNKIANRWQKDANGFLIFVSAQHLAFISLCITPNNRPVYSLLPFQY
jgi:hypothetical protein